MRVIGKDLGLPAIVAAALLLLASTVPAGTVYNGCENVATGAVRLLPSSLPPPLDTACNTNAVSPLLREVAITLAQPVDLTAVNSAIAALQAQDAALQAQLATVQGSISALQAQNAAQQTQLAAVQANSALALGPYLTVDPTRNLVLLQGVNLQLVNGLGRTDSRNGLGNLLIGYDAPRDDNTYFCSDASAGVGSDCEATGETWAVSLKGGSHYLVIGDQNNYSQYGGLVTGWRNTSNVGGANVTGGIYSNASAVRGRVSGGYLNTASGINSSVSGGWSNTASGSYASVSGGHGSTAAGYAATVSGGEDHSAPDTNNWAAGTYSSPQ